MKVWKGVNIEEVEREFVRSLVFSASLESEFWLFPTGVELVYEKDRDGRQVVNVIYRLDFESYDFNMNMLEKISELASAFGLSIKNWSVIPYNDCKYYEDDGCLRLTLEVVSAQS